MNMTRNKVTKYAERHVEEAMVGGGTTNWNSCLSEVNWEL